MCDGYLKSIFSDLQLFQQQPKIIEGKKIKDWFKVGETIFEGFYNLGLAIDWDYSKIQTEEQIKEIMRLFTVNKEWLESFISLYPSFRIDFDLVCSADDICKIRSGLEVLLRGFVNIDQEFDKLLSDFEDLAEVEEFDRLLKIWADSGHRPDFKTVNSSVPDSHWWWF